MIPVIRNSRKTKYNLWGKKSKLVAEGLTAMGLEGILIIVSKLMKHPLKIKVFFVTHKLRICLNKCCF